MEIAGKKLFRMYDMNITTCAVLQKLTDRMTIKFNHQLTQSEMGF
jgi:hypothetical protein